MVQLEQDGDSNTFLQCQWYYRPEDTFGKRRPFHGSKEVFISDHVDEQTTDSVLDRCRVLSYEEYSKQTVVGKNDFFFRFAYSTSTQAFTPDRITVYAF